MKRKIMSVLMSLSLAVIIAGCSSTGSKSLQRPDPPAPVGLLGDYDDFRITSYNGYVVYAELKTHNPKHFAEAEKKLEKHILEKTGGLAIDGKRPLTIFLIRLDDSQ